MKLATVAIIGVVALALSCAAEASPISKVLQMIADLEKKTIAAGEASAKAYDAFAKKCTSGAQEFGFQIETSKTEIEELTATITKETASVTATSSKIEEISASISTAEVELKSATEIRAKEGADFAAEEKELSAVIDALNRAISILSKELSSGASLLQVQNAGSLTQALTVMVQASMLSTADASRLTSLAQVSQQAEDSDTDQDEDMAPPAAAAYQSKSGGIVSTMEDLLEKAEAQLEKARKDETTSIFNFKKLEQSLKDEISYAEVDMSKTKKTKSKSTETKSVAEGDLSVSKKDLKVTQETLATFEHDCMTEAEEYEEEKKSRAEELKALAEATKVIKEAMSFVSEGSSPVSFLQQSLSSRMEPSNDAVRFIRNLGRQHHSTALTQLASRMASVMRLGNVGGQDPFAKVKGLITGMVEKLEAEAEEEAGHKEYCDKNLAEGTEKKTDLESSIKDLSTTMDQSAAKSASLKAQIAELEKELAANSKMLAEEGLLRTESHKTYVENKAETEKGVKGVQLALKVLKEYYAKGDKSHSSGDGAASGIISLLEVCESDMSKELAEMTSTEESEASEYEKLVKQIELTQASKEQDVKYKTKEAASLAKAASDLSGDIDGKQSELDAALQFLAELTKECAAKVDPYEERKARREAELEGLKTAMEILDGETMLLQQRSTRRSLRGVRPHLS